MLPPGKYRCSPRDVERRFVDSFPVDSNRATIYREWRSYRAAMCNLAPLLHQWIDGSFVTNKLNPGDIDVISFIDGNAFDKLPRWKQDVIAELNNGKGDAAYSHVDAKIVAVFSKNNLNSRFYQDAKVYWDRQWSRSKNERGILKGYLEVA